jgi:hypothetical protein
MAAAIYACSATYTIRAHVAEGAKSAADVVAQRRPTLRHVPSHDDHPSKVLTAATGET